MSEFIFWSFSTLMILSAFFVVVLRGGVRSVILLILCFASAASILLMADVEYISMTLLIVYVGAIAVLFLFVIMMIGEAEVLSFRRLLGLIPLAVSVCLIIFAGIYIAKMYSPDFYPPASSVVTELNTRYIGSVLYTKYFIPFQLTGFLLLVAMIGAILLTSKYQRTSRKIQDCSAQVKRGRDVKLIKVDFNKGIEL
ncbi:NADH-quinone oxidoreductase subunit J [Candidatus Cyrtobacter comes]|uniref:NADH-quinone oxidoreductase subunit J n=1 Tax=Candidatus Cyrtobacter comes TaxID=675776 RepID=A0ABU5L6X6_9RICK|nr:NADH-quinone oxidoreductase subunit J [Candidatus Cyrtobacter comes]MDZ5761876.1 NADH-quinone oxidoreductase subunit J [Candidatus Cyrtobacter comes]